ncbi:MAG: ABC transporter permease [Chloroflexi bacterium]|nr:ABC transporter permease [Chloroflexota bacterium]MCL5107938.1 ABC transporter permease [Chloroflexota bacterium]
MLSYVARRLLFVLLTLLLSSLVIFGVTQLLPGDVATMILGRFATPEALARLRGELGLDRPLYVQYWDWLWRFVKGDWGTSLATGTAIQPWVMERLRNSAMLAGVGLVMSVPLAVVLGVVAAMKRDSWLDHVISVFSLALVGLPEFVTGLVFIGVLALGLKWLPASSAIEPDAGFFDALPKLILPGLTITLVMLAYVARMTRSGTIEVLKTDYIRTAYLKGLPAHEVILNHVLRNALLPTVTIIAISIGWLIGGLIVTESVFGYPGLGRLLLYSIQHRDLPLLQAVSMLVVAIYSLANLLADVVYAYLNPRIRLS